jgi:hypothetical protein
MGETKKFIEAMPVWMKLGVPAQVPFANQAADISSLSQSLRQCLLALRQSDAGKLIAMANGIGLIAEAGLISSSY